VSLVKLTTCICHRVPTRRFASDICCGVNIPALIFLSSGQAWSGQNALPHMDIYMDRLPMSYIEYTDKGLSVVSTLLSISWFPGCYHLRAGWASIGNKRGCVRKGCSRCDPSRTNKGKKKKKNFFYINLLSTSTLFFVLF
jgi:hypothetical protein